jgi:hypothetical protein
LAAHTLARPPGARRLFVEGYFMRTLVAAQDICDSLPHETPEWFDAPACRDAALSWADGLVTSQDKFGYWPLGYGAVYIADMAAALALFPALGRDVDAERMANYEKAARRFTAALAADGMLLPSGAVGVGWWGTTLPRLERRASREPYLVSTALAGIELHAWLYSRDGLVADRNRALQALDYTLTQIQPDGSLAMGPRLPGTDAAESRLTIAAYTEEGWMAADALLGDPAVQARLRTALRPHVDWLLGLQRPDGRWDEGSEGEFARTPSIVDFLMWFDARCESRPEIRAAIGRAATALVDPAQWDTNGFWKAGNHYEVQRAIAGRALAALGRGRFVL